MTRRNRVLAVVLLLAMAVCLSACGSSDKKNLVGTWSTVSKFEDKVNVTFNDNGTFTWEHQSTLGNVTTTGKYALNEKNKILTMYPDKDTNDMNSANGKEWNFSYMFTSDRITFYNTDTKEAVYNFQKKS